MTFLLSSAPKRTGGPIRQGASFRLRPLAERMPAELWHVSSLIGIDDQIAIDDHLPEIRYRVVSVVEFSAKAITENIFRNKDSTPPIREAGVQIWAECRDDRISLGCSSSAPPRKRKSGAQATTSALES